MKIGILTYHRAINYGAFLQGYSLMSRLQKDFPDDDIEIIDYNHKNRERFIRKCPLVFVYRRGIKDALYKAIQTHIFKKSLTHLKLSKSLLCSDDKSVEDYISQNYDIVIVGSDAVFNWNDLGIPNPYFLYGVKGPYKMSYAASAHLQRFNSSNEEELSYLQKSLSDFDFLGVRDANTEGFVNALSISEKAVHNCDPAIFFPIQDCSEEDLKAKLHRHKFDFSKRTVFVMMMKPQYAKYVRDYFGEDVQLVALMDGNKYADVYLYDLTPFEWAHVFTYGECLVTDYFHGTIFALKNGIPVMSIDSSNYNDDYESKAFDLLSRRLNAPELYINGKELLSENGFEVFSDRMTEILNTFDKNKIYDSINDESKEYISLYNEIQKIKEMGGNTK